MALPIKDTPTLTGEDADRFLDEVYSDSPEKVSSEERKEIHKNYEFIKSISKF